MMETPQNEYKYYIDLDTLMKFICDNEKYVSSTITESYGETDNEEMDLLSKEVVESVDNFNTYIMQNKYEIVKTMLDAVLYTNDYVTNGQKLAFNTFINSGIIKEKQ